MSNGNDSSTITPALNLFAEVTDVEGSVSNPEASLSFRKTIYQLDRIVLERTVDSHPPKPSDVRRVTIEPRGLKFSTTVGSKVRGFRGGLGYESITVDGVEYRRIDPKDIDSVRSHGSGIDSGPRVIEIDGLLYARKDLLSPPARDDYPDAIRYRSSVYVKPGLTSVPKGVDPDDFDTGDPLKRSLGALDYLRLDEFSRTLPKS